MLKALILAGAAMIWGCSPYIVNQASLGSMPMRCIPGMKSRTTNSKDSCSRPGRISHVINSLTATLFLLPEKYSQPAQEREGDSTPQGLFRSNPVILEKAGGYLQPIF
jgi:hypothetical protein